MSTIRFPDPRAAFQAAQDLAEEPSLSLTSVTLSSTGGVIVYTTSTDSLNTLNSHNKHILDAAWTQLAALMAGGAIPIVREEAAAVVQASTEFLNESVERTVVFTPLETNLYLVSAYGDRENAPPASGLSLDLTWTSANGDEQSLTGVQGGNDITPYLSLTQLVYAKAGTPITVTITPSGMGVTYNFSARIVQLPTLQRLS
jgi:hypothetical protein